jgi:GNAT superfamily N-acetyltransferase
VIRGFPSRESYRASGIPRDVLGKAVAGPLCFEVYDDAGRQVSFARVVTDRATFAYLCDVFVLPSHRGRWLSKWLLECVVSRISRGGRTRPSASRNWRHGSRQRS